MSQSPSSPDRASPSILAQALPLSPNLLDPDSSSDLQDRELHGVEQQGETLEQVSDETSAQSESNAVLPPPPPDDDQISNDSSSTVTYNAAHDSVYETGDENTRDSNADMVRSPDIQNEHSYSNPVSVNEDSNPISLSSSSNSSVSINHTRKASECDEPPSKVRKVSSSSKNDEIDAETCPICLDAWGNSGVHRLVSLKCGHLFGYECVERWLKAQNSKERSCPTCKSKAAMKDIRFIYAKRLVAADTAEITSLQKQVEILKEEKNRTELQLQKSEIAHRACVLQLEVLRSTLMKSQVSKDQATRKSWRFPLEKNLEVYKDGSCRVMTYNSRTYELYVSQKSMNHLFPGYGIRKVSCVDYKLGQFVHLHPKPIRDITYSQPRDLLLSVALDCSARVLDRGIPNVTVDAGFPLWSCSWDYLRSNIFYVGGVGGMIHQYDIRNTSTFVANLQAPGNMSPVISLCSTQFGLLSCQLNTCWLWVNGSQDWEPRALPVDGSFMSMSYDNDTQRALISVRPSLNGTERSKLSICKFKSSVPTGEVLIDVEDTFNGSARSTKMCRAAWVKAPGATWVAAHSETDATLYLHGIDGTRTISLPAVEPVLDVCSMQVNGANLLAALSESRLRLYKSVVMNA